MRNCLPRMYEALARSELWGADIMAVGDPMRRVRFLPYGIAVGVLDVGILDADGPHEAPKHEAPKHEAPKHEAPDHDAQGPAE